MDNCPCCGCENEPDANFCEDCGAQLTGLASSDELTAQPDLPRDPGDVVIQRFLIEANVEAGHICRYLALDQRQGEKVFLLECRVENEDSCLRKQMDIVKELPIQDCLWMPSELIPGTEFDYLYGPVPGDKQLATLIEEQGALDGDTVLDLGIQLADILSRLHEHGIIVRAFSPRRVWLRTLEDNLKVILDPFGRCSYADDDSHDYTVISGFSPPEAYGIGSAVLDETSDIFTAGAILHFALTGEVTDLEARDNFFRFSRPASTSHQPLIDVILKATNRDKQARFATALALKNALIQAGESQVDSDASPLKPESCAPDSQIDISPPLQPPPHTATLPLKYEVALRSDIGMVRRVNQDAYLELSFHFMEADRPQKAHLIAVIDGMGGEAEGDKAASLALRALAQSILHVELALLDGRSTTPLVPPSPRERSKHLLTRALKEANRIIYDYSQQDARRKGMGCTITACLLGCNYAVFGHIGDTRALLIRDQIEQITTDHSLVGRLVQMGQLTIEEARNSPQRSIIYRAMGTNPEVEVDIYERDLLPGDYLMLSSDGVWEYFDHQELLSIFRNQKTPTAISEKLISLCLERGADDNATVAIIKAEASS